MRENGMVGKNCSTCHSEMEWTPCYKCDGRGGRDGEELMQEDPLWYDEDDFETCDVCKGEGHYWFCVNRECSVTISS